MKKNILIILLLLSVCAISPVFGASYFDVHNRNMNGTTTLSGCRGVVINASVPLTITGIEQNFSDTATVVYIYEDAVLGTAGACPANAIANGTFSGTKAPLNRSIQLTANRNYTILIGVGSHIMAFGAEGNTPVTGNTSFIRYVLGANGGAMDTTIRELRGIYYDYNVSPALTITISNIVNNTVLNGFCINATGTNTSQNLCNMTGSTVVFNTTGTYNITVYNVSSSTYLNSSIQNFLFDTTKTLAMNTSQSILNITVTQLYTGKSISSFNTTNNKAINTTQGTSYDIIPSNNGTNNIQIDVTGNYSINGTCINDQLLSTQNCTIYGVYDNLYTIGAKYAGAGINNFSVNLTNTTFSQLDYHSTANGSTVFPTIQGLNYVFYMIAPGYAYDNKTLNSNASAHLYNFSLLTANIVNFTFYDERNGSAIGSATTITLELISSIFSANYTTNTSNITTNILSPTSYTARYYASNYATRFYTFTLTNNTYQNIALPMLPTSSSTSVTVTVIDNVANVISGAVVRLYKYDLASNTYKLNQVFTTNSEGVGVVTVQLNNEFYYFTVEINGQIVLVTSPSYIFGTSVQLTVFIADNAFSTLYDSNGIIGVISNSTPTYFTFTYSDRDNIASQGCLKVYNIGVHNLNYVTSTCISGSGGSVNYNITNTTISYYLYGVVTKNNADYVAATRIVNFDTSTPTENSSPMWMFVMLLVMVILAIMFRDSPAISIVVTSAIPFLFSIIHLIPISVGYTLPLLIIGIIIAVIIGL